MKRIQYLSGALCCGLLATALCPSLLSAPAPRAVQQQAAPRKTAPTLVVQGKVKAITRTPRPGSVPYKDAVIAIHLTGVKAIKGKLNKGSILVYAWGMRGNKLTPTASYKVGQIIKLSLQPWEKVEGKYGRYQRFELNDEAALSLDAFWGEPVK